MTKAISTCPACQGKLHIATLACPDCGMELRNTFDLSPFDMLDDEKAAFLLSFLRNRGNLKNVQAELQISYPTAKRRLDEVLIALDLFEEDDLSVAEREEIDMRNWFTDHTSTKASEIIKTKLKKNGGRVICVGTTSCRTLESAYGDGQITECSGDTSIFIYPGYKFKCIDGLLTNFHLPESTLIMLVSAFYGYDKTMSAYKEAVDEKYRFFSFGDCMLII